MASAQEFFERLIESNPLVSIIIIFVVIAIIVLGWERIRNPS
jgi:hypothetical protein